MKEFEKTFIDDFAKEISKFGFNKRRRTYIYRKTNLGGCGIRLGFSKELYGFDIRSFVSVRFDDVEKIVGQFPPNQFWKEKATLYTELGRLIDGQIKTWSISLESDKKVGNIYLAVREEIGLPQINIVPDFESVIKDISAKYEKFGLPFHEKYCDSFGNALNILSRDDKEAISLNPPIDDRAKCAITTAFLLGNERLFEEIVRKKESLLRGQNHFGLEDFLNLKSTLRKEFKL